MILQWGQHSEEMMEKLSSLLNKKSLLDITLAAEGKFLKAHRVILAASSTYFEDLLLDSQEQNPVIYFRDVSFQELEVLVQFIYTGVVDVPGSCLDSFLSLAKSLGVTGFLNSSENTDVKSPAKRKLLLSDSLVKVNENDKENIQPELKGAKNNSAPSTPTKNIVNASLTTSANKKRRTLAESLGKVDSFSNPHPQPITEPNQPLYANTGSYPLSSQNQPLYDNLPNIQPKNIPYKEKPIAQVNDIGEKTCKSDMSTSKSKNGSNFSFDCHFPNPEELEAQGATLLHHLAVWMIQQQKEEVGNNDSNHTAVKDELPAPSVDEYTNTVLSPHRHSKSLPTRKQALISSSLVSSSPNKPNPRAGSECDRPDSGFESKDDIEDEKITKDEGSSPEIREISRQSLARQPILKKKRIINHRF